MVALCNPGAWWLWRRARAEQRRRGAQSGICGESSSNVGKESRREIQITYCEPWFWVRLSELLGCFWYFVGLYVCLVWVGELLQIGHSINSSPSRSISVTQRPSRSRSDSDLLQTEVAGQKEELLVGYCIRNRDKIQMMACCCSSLGQISISQKKKKIQKEEERVTLCLVR